MHHICTLTAPLHKYDINGINLFLFVEYKRQDGRERQIHVGGAQNCFQRQCSCWNIHKYIYIHRVSQKECARIREGVPYVKVYRYNPEHLCPKLNGYGDNSQKKVWSSGGSTHCTCQLTTLSMSVLECGVILRQFTSCPL